MKTITIKDIRALGPCYDPSRHLDEEWKGTIIDILKMKNINAANRIWFACHKEFMSEKDLRLFAISCARRALARIKDPDPCSVHALDIAEKYANEEATLDELKNARDAAAYFIASDAASDAAAYASTAYAIASDTAYYAIASGAAERESQIEKLIEIIENQSKEKEGE